MTVRAAKTLTALRSLVRELLREASPRNWSDTLIDQAVNDRLQELWGYLVRKMPDMYAPQVSITYTASSEKVELAHAGAPVGPDRVLMVERTDDPNYPVKLKRIQMTQQTKYSLPPVATSVGFPQGFAPMYAVSGEAQTDGTVKTYVRLAPTPRSDMKLRVFYLPDPPVLAAGTEAHGLPLEAEPILYYGAAADLVGREAGRAEPSFLRKAAELEAKFKANYDTVTLDGPARVTDTQEWL